MSAVQTPALFEVEHLLARLKSLGAQHQRAGRISHAQGVHSAIELIKRDRKAGKGFKPQK